MKKHSLLRKMRLFSYTSFLSVASVSATAGCACSTPPGTSLSTNAKAITSLISNEFINQIPKSQARSMNDYHWTGLYVAATYGDAAQNIDVWKARLQSSVYLNDNKINSLTDLKNNSTYYVSGFMIKNNSSNKDPDKAVLARFTFDSSNFLDLAKKHTLFKNAVNKGVFPNDAFSEIKFYDYNSKLLSTPS